MGELVGMVFHALAGPFLDRHPGVEAACVLVFCLMALAWAALIWWEKRNALRRIRQATGEHIKTESELTSLNTWMRVQDEEERQSNVGHLGVSA